MFTKENIAQVVQSLNQQFDEQKALIKEFIETALPLKLLEFVGAQKFALKQSSINDMYQYLVSDEVTLTFFDALSEELMGKDASIHTHHLKNAYKKVIQEEIKCIADKLVRDFVLLLINGDLVCIKHPKLHSAFGTVDQLQLLVDSLSSSTIKELQKWIDLPDEDEYSATWHKDNELQWKSLLL